jgi:NAD(P)-dependent dehydrogenase (short-subunit alcohol dehydrogenase family)
MSENGKWNTENMPDMSGTIAIVTGANSGIGYETARFLALKGSHVIMACRNMEKGEAALEQLTRMHPQVQIEVMQLDLSDLESVQDFADDFTKRFDRLDLLINNAGIMMTPYGKTADGFELQFGTNHLGHFALTGLLLDLLERTPGARVVTISSMAHRMGEMDFMNLNAEQDYDRQGAYAQSKLANLLFAYELQRRLESAGADVISTAAHPGWTATNLQENFTLGRLLNPIVAMKPEMGALPTLRAATATDVQGGDYYGPGGWQGMRGYPKKERSSDLSYDRELAAQLWTVSEELTGVQYSHLD